MTRLLAALVLTAGLGACETGEPEAGPSFAFVRGTVTTLSGSGVPGATVLLEIFRAADGGRIGQEPTTADGTGAYLIRLAVFLPPFDALVDVTVTPPDTTVLSPGSVRGRPVRFSAPAATDTARVNVVLQPA